jgi:hypothetical protein
VINEKDAIGAALPRNARVRKRLRFGYGMNYGQKSMYFWESASVSIHFDPSLLCSCTLPPKRVAVKGRLWPLLFNSNTLT